MLADVLFGGEVSRASLCVGRAATATGHGPFNALHLCLRKCLSKLYPQITEVRLTDYKVRVLDSYKALYGKSGRKSAPFSWFKPST